MATEIECPVVEIDKQGSPKCFDSLRTPFGSSEYWTSRVSGLEVSFSIRFEIVPKGSAAFLGPEGNVDSREDGTTSLFYVAHLIEV